MSDTLLHEVAELSDRLLPPEPAEFFDDFWAQAAARERRDARRWRRVSLAAAAAALAAVSAAAVVAATYGSTNVVDEHVTCKLLSQGGRSVVYMDVAATRKPHAGFTHPTSAQVMLVTGAEWFAGTKLLLLDNAAKGYLLDRRLCRTGGSIPLARRGLPKDQTLVKGYYTGREYRCSGTGPVIVRAHVVQGSNGQPVKAQVAVASARTNKPLLYTDWTPDRVTSYAAPSCDAGEF